jgi:hypothetical protein
LLTGGENEVSAAVDTLQNLVLEFHGKVLPSAHDPSNGLGEMQLRREPD